MAKNRVMAQKNAKVRKYDSANRRETKLAALSMADVTLFQTESRLNNNSGLSLSINEWKSMYAEVL